MRFYPFLQDFFLGKVKLLDLVEKKICVNNFI